MSGAGQAMKRIPRIKFPVRHPKASATSQHQEMATNEAVGQTFFQGLRPTWLWEERLLINQNERRCLKRRLNLSCWAAVSDPRAEHC